MTKRPWGISDRSGMRFPMDQMVLEPGTGYLVHKSESDGQWSLTEHPLSNPQRYQRFGDPRPTLHARPDQSFVVDLFLLDENEDYILDHRGLPIDAPI